MSTYESTVLIPVSAFLDACASQSSDAGGSDQRSASSTLGAKSDAVASICQSLSSANSEGGAALEYWTTFLLDSGGGDFDSPEAEFRRLLLDSLVSCCTELDSHTHVESTTSDCDASVLEEALHLRTRALDCLSEILAVRNEFGRSRRKGQECSLVGSRLATLTPSLIPNFADDTASSDGAAAVAAATRLIRSLLPPGCPRDECPPAQIRDLVLVPLSSPTGTSNAADTSVAVVADMLRHTVVASANSAADSVGARAGGSSSDNTELRTLKVESAALRWMQEFRPVLDNLVLYLLASSGGGSGGRALQSLRDVYELAPHAMESQLGGGEEMLALLRGDDGESQEQRRNPAAAVVVEEEAEAEVGSGDDGSLPPFYDSLTNPPITITTERELRTRLDTISADLNEEDSEMWNVRFEALKTLERMLAGGIVRSTASELRAPFFAAVRKMSIERQILDLRSQITRQACRFATALAYELREVGEQDASVAMANLVELWTPAILKLCISGVRLMAMQGINCLLHLAALGGTCGYPRVVPTLCDGCVGKKVHQNHRRGCILALTTALRVWGSHCLERHVDGIVKAVSESACHRDPSVREEGRKAFWALHERGGEFRSLADGLLDRMDGRERKRLKGAKVDADAEWSTGGRMQVLVRTGVDVAALSPKSSSSSSSLSSSSSRTSAGSSRPSSSKATGRRPGSKASSRPSAGMNKAAGGKMSALRAAKVQGRKSVAAAAQAPSQQVTVAVATPSSKSRASPTPRSKVKPALPEQARRGGALPSTMPPTTPGRRVASGTPSAARSARKPNSSRLSSATTPSRFTPRNKSTPARGRTTPVRYSTPSRQRITRSIEGFLQMADAQWSQREKAFVTISSLLEKDMTGESGDTSPSSGRPIDVGALTMGSASTRRFVEVLLDNMKERNIRVCKSATQCCHVCLRHPEMGPAIGAHIPLLLPGILNALAKYDRGGAATARVHGAAMGCLQTILGLAGSHDTIRLFSLVLANHNAEARGGRSGAGKGSYHPLSDGGLQYLIDMLRSALTDVSDGPDDGPLFPPEDMTGLLSHLAKIVNRPSDRYAGTPQHLTRSVDDKLKDSVCKLLKLLLGGNDVQYTIRVLLAMKRDEVDALVECIWTFGGHWGGELREKVVSAISAEGSKHRSEREQNVFGGEFSEKSSADQADLFSDLLSPPAKIRSPESDPPRSLSEAKTPSPESDPQRSLNEAKTPKTPAIPQGIRTRLLEEPQQAWTPEADASAAVIPSPSSRVADTPEADAPSEAIPAPSSSVADTAKTPVASLKDENKYTPYEKALRSLRKGKTPLLERTPTEAPNTDAVLKYMIRPSPLSPLVAKQLCEFDDRVLPRIVEGLSKASLPQEQYLMLQTLLQHAKDNSTDEEWEECFPAILKSLLAGFSGKNVEPLSSLPLNAQSSSTATLSAKKGDLLSQSATVAASKHLYLQGLRALIKYLPSQHFENHIDEVVDQLLQCSKCSTYEITHIAERTLQCLVEKLEPQRCLETLMPHLQEEIIGDDDECAVVLMTLRTLCKLIKRAREKELLDALPALKPALYASLKNQAVDMRKAAVFVIVEMYFMVPNLMEELEGLTAPQHKLVSIYVERKEKEGTELKY